MYERTLYRKIDEYGLEPKIVNLKKVIMGSQLFIISCGLYSLAGSIPPHIKTISIPLVENQTSDFSLSADLTDEIILQFTESGILSIQNEDEAHSTLKGTIKKSLIPYSYNKNESISEYRYKIDVKIEWYDNTKENIIDKNYSGFGAYGLSGDISSDGIDNDNDGKIDSEDDNEFGEPRSFAAKVAIDKIAEDISNDIMTTW